MLLNVRRRYYLFETIDVDTLVNGLAHSGNVLRCGKMMSLHVGTNKQFIRIEIKEGPMPANA